jgi:alkanesulfonate monooxygenase SsuD/methylene tetrahydromethanopterin reductase-like flavin-dependent oxidoreductase (luciferase family)
LTFVTTMDLGPFGFAIDRVPDDAHLTAATEIEKLGFTTLWMAGGQLDTLERLADLAQVTERAVVAPSIIPPDVYAAAAVLDLYTRLEATHPGRLLVGLGAPQRPRALDALGTYLDVLDTAEHPIPANDESLPRSAHANSTSPASDSRVPSRCW